MVISNQPPFPHGIIDSVMSWRSWRERFTRGFSPKPSGRFEIRIYYPEAQTFDPVHAPFELAFGLRIGEDRMAIARSLIERGYGIGVRSITGTPADIREAVERIAVTQGCVYEPWLSRLIFQGEIPVFTNTELLDAQDAGTNLYGDAQTILSARPSALRYVLADIEARGVADADLLDVSQLHGGLEPLSAAYLYHRIRSDRKDDTLQIQRRFVRALFIGLLVFFLMPGFPGFSFVLAAMIEPVWTEIREGIAKRRSGYTPRQLFFACLPQLLLFLPVAWTAWQSHMLFDAGHRFASGVVFALACLAYPLLHDVRALADIRGRIGSLDALGKLPVNERPSLASLAFWEWMSRTHRAARVMGYVVFPFVMGLLLVIVPEPALVWLLAFTSVLFDAVTRGFLRLRSHVDRWWFYAVIRHRMPKTSL